MRNNPTTKESACQMSFISRGILFPDITPHEENIVKARHEVALPPLLVIIRIRNDTVNVEEMTY
ncbi:hypothetical protein JCM10914A_45310 [Paenibacillus sp. JCM 10914]